MGEIDRCTCEPPARGPPWDDGADPGMCAYCEEQAWRDEHGQHDEDLQDLADGKAPLTLDDFLSLWGEMNEGSHSYG